MTSKPGSVVLPRDRPAADDYDESGRYLYPGHVEGAMPEGNLAWWLAVYLVQTMARLVVDPATASAHGNMPIYYAKGEPRRYVAPDAFYLPGVPSDPTRRSYCLWRTGVVPRVTFEIVSRHHEFKDEVRNRALYQQLGVPEYYWFDPERILLTALRLDPSTGRYRQIAPDAAGRYPSPALGLEVGLEQVAPFPDPILALFQGGELVEPGAQLIARLHQALAAATENVERERAEKEQALKRAERLEAELRELKRRLDT